MKNKKSKNKDEIVGEGILCSIYMWNALQDAHIVEVNGKRYGLVFQCRIDPKKMKITPNDDYWMANNFCDIRPYGIILVEEKVKNCYPKPS